MMRGLFAAALFSAAVALPVAAQAEGSRMVAGGNLMSSYVDHPHHDPRSLWSQSNRTGEILGPPMFSERAGAPYVSRQTVSRQNLVTPSWATETRRLSKRGLSKRGLR